MLQNTADLIFLVIMLHRNIKPFTFYILVLLTRLPVCFSHSPPNFASNKHPVWVREVAYYVTLRFSENFFFLNMEALHCEQKYTGSSAQRKQSLSTHLCGHFPKEYMQNLSWWLKKRKGKKQVRKHPYFLFL